MKVWGVAKLTAALLVVAGTAAAGEWQQVHPQTEPSFLTDVATDGSRWVAVATNGELLESPDGNQWEVTRPVEGSWSASIVAVAAGGGVVVVVSGDGNADVRAADGAWHRRIWTGVPRVGDLRWDGQRFVLLGDDTPFSPGPSHPTAPENAVIATSPDGFDWTVRAVIPDGSTPGLSRVASGGGIRVAVGVMLGVYGAGGEVDFATLVSGDGEGWEVTSGQPNLQLADWDGSRFVAVDAGDALIGARGPVLTSVDGQGWEESGLETVVNLHDLACGAARCLGVASGSLVEIDLSAGSVVSTPGPPGLRLQACSCSDERCVVVGPDRTILASDRVGAWEVVYSSREPDLVAVAEHGGAWVAVGVPRPPSGTALSSRDGVSWSPAQVPDPTVALADVAWAGDAFAAVGDGGLVLESADGTVWRRVPAPTAEPLRAIAGDGRAAVAVGGLRRGVLLIRQPGGGWVETARALPPLADVVWDGRRYLVAGAEGTLLESPDGEVWSPVGGLRPIDLAWVTSNGRRVLVGGEWGSATSVDGLRWRTASATDTGPVEWTGRGFFGFGRPVRTSPDGLSWGGLWGYSVANDAASSRAVTVFAGAAGRVTRREGVASVRQPVPFRILLPIIASGAGTGGSQWSSEVWVRSLAILSPASPPSAFLLRDGAAAADLRARDLPTTVGARFHDPVAEMFALDGGAGALLLAGEERQLAGGLIVSGSGEGLYRQLVPATAIDDDPSPRLLPLLGATAATRVNLALTNSHDEAVEALVEVVADDGGVRGRLQVSLTPWSSRLVTDVVRRATGGDVLVEPLLRILPLDGRPAPVALASIVDDATDDPISVTPAAVSDEALAVPAVAHNPGFGASLWRSDLMLHNPGPFAARFRLELHPLDDWRTVHRTPWLQLAAGASVRYHDVVESVFGQGGTGWLRVALSSGRLTGISRTYDVAAPSPLGHPVPAVDEASVRRDATVWAGGLRASRAPVRRTRARIGVVNLDDRAQVAEITVYRADDGERLANLRFAVRPGDQTYRELIPERDWFPEGQSEVSLILEAVPGTRGPRLLVFGSTIDAGTGDAQLVVATPRD